MRRQQARAQAMQRMASVTPGGRERQAVVAKPRANAIRHDNI